MPRPLDRPRSTSMDIRRPGMVHILEYNAQTDEVLLQRPEGPMALSYDAFIEAFERRVDDNCYRPMSEEDRARETRERTSGRR